MKMPELPCPVPTHESPHWESGATMEEAARKLADHILEAHCKSPDTASASTETSDSTG